MRSPGTSQPWRLLQLPQWQYKPCPDCGQVHHYLTRRTALGECLPAVFPPGIPAPTSQGTEVAAYIAGPVERDLTQEERSAYRELAERVRQTTIRCEGCGERFDDLEEYRVHDCEVRYR